MVDYKEDIFPERMVKAMRQYVEQHQPPGDFLTAVLSNNLRKAFRYADDENKLLIEQYVDWAYWQIPDLAWGSPEAVAKWIAKGKK